MATIDESWAREPTRLRGGRWITVALQQTSKGWHYIWWWRRSAHEDIVGTDVSGGSAEPLESERAARAAAIAEAEAEAAR